MAKDLRKRQRKLERRKSKDKQRKKALAEREPQNVATRIERAAAAPILHCCTTDALFNRGMSNVLVSRELSNGTIAFVAFLVDMYCLGVKDVAMGVTTRRDYDWRVYTKMTHDHEVVDLDPAAARKLVEGAVEFAGQAGFLPHRDYRKGKLIFGDIDVTACTEEFTYGKEGKVFFIAGPHDSPMRCREIVNVLDGRFGPDGFDYLIPLSSSGAGLVGGAVRALEDSGEIEERSD